jgi:outer membrane protein OmpA-like peptidoglycan-associated protein
MKRPKLTVLVFLICLSLTANPGFAAPDEYDESQANPFRIVAYLVHPFGVITEWLVLRPFHYLVSANEQNEKLFGHRPHPPLLEPQPLYDFGMAERIPMETQSRPKQVSALPAGEQVRLVEVPVEKIVTQEVIKEVPQVVEVERVIFEGVAFRFDSAELTDLGQGQVYLAAQRLKDKTDVTIVVEGHTDNVGTDEYNQKLGLRRAETIINELTRLGIDTSKMTMTSSGESKPLVNQDNAWAHALNRRVEFQMKAAR